MNAVEAMNGFSSVSLANSWAWLPSSPAGAESGMSGFDALASAAAAATATAGAMRYWRSQRQEALFGPSRQRLIEHALLGLDSFGSGSSPSGPAREQTLELFKDLIADAQPTPQVAVEEDGGVETIWLVNGIEVVALVRPDGSGTLSASEVDREIFEFSFDKFLDPLDRTEIAEARRLLNHLGESVDFRVLV
jgi:hypothetical protein